MGTLNQKMIVTQAEIDSVRQDTLIKDKAFDYIHINDQDLSLTEKVAILFLRLESK